MFHVAIFMGTSLDDGFCEMGAADVDNVAVS